MSVDRDTFKHAAVYSAAAMLSKIISFLLLPFYAHILLDTGYGIIGMTDTALSFLMSLLAQGIRGATIRHYHEEETERGKRLVASTSVWVIAAASLVLVLLGAAGSKPLSSLLLGDSTRWHYLCLALATFYFDLVAESSGTLLIIRRKSVVYSSVGLLRLVLGLSLNIWFVLVQGMGVLGVFLAGLITAMVSSTVMTTIMVRAAGAGFDREIARKLIAFQLPLVPGSLASFFSRQAERVLVRFTNAIEAVGVLEMAYKFPVLINLLVHQPFMRSWDTGRVQIADEPDGPQRIGRMFTYAIFLLVASGLLMAVAIENALRLMTPDVFWDAHRIAKIEIVTVVMQGLVYHVNFGIFLRKATKEWAVLRGVTSGIKLGLSVLFVSLWGLYGAAFSACITALITLIWGGRLGFKHYSFPMEKGKILLLVVSAVAIFGVLEMADFSDDGWLEPARERWIPAAVDAFEGTFLGTWKDGKITRALDERGDLILDTVVRVGMAAGFFLLLPVVHDPTRKKILGRLGAGQSSG